LQDAAVQNVLQQAEALSAELGGVIRHLTTQGGGHPRLLDTVLNDVVAQGGGTEIVWSAGGGEEGNKGRHSARRSHRLSWGLIGQSRRPHDHSPARTPPKL
jgi:hypothetical protein